MDFNSFKNWELFLHFLQFKKKFSIEYKMYIETRAVSSYVCHSLNNCEDFLFCLLLNSYKSCKSIKMNELYKISMRKHENNMILM